MNDSERDTVPSLDAHRTLVLGFDFSDSSELALEQSLELVRILPSVTLHVVWVARHPLEGLEPYTTPVDYKALAEHLRQHITQRAQAHQEVGTYAHTLVEMHVTSGDPVGTINDVAFYEDADLIVLGAHGGRGIERLLHGSIESEVLATAPCPVLIARPRVSEHVPRIEPPHPDHALPTLGKRHTYHAVDRNAQAHENMPLLFPF